MIILTAHVYHESNTFCPQMTRLEDFSVYTDQDMLGKLAAHRVFADAGAAIVPTVYASRWPSGIVERRAFDCFEDHILQAVSGHQSELDGIYLSLHGSMVVEGIGSGEYRLLQDIRAIVGDRLPISVCLDMHANNCPQLQMLCNCICGYHTAPHTDIRKTQEKAALALVDMIRKGRAPKPALVRLPMLLVGEKAITDMEPMCSALRMCDQAEAGGRVYDASVFVGMAWSDTENTAATVAVSPKTEADSDFARHTAEAIGAYVMKRRDEFAFAHPSYPPLEAVRAALDSAETPVFLSDSGDNPTAGAQGGNTALLHAFQRLNTRGKRVLFAPIFDDRAYKRLSAMKPGTEADVCVGQGTTADTQPVAFHGVIVRFGEVFACHDGLSEKIANYALVAGERADVIITDRQVSFTGPECFESAGVLVSDYDVVVLKMGYVFDEIRPLCKTMLMALTPGITPLAPEAGLYRNLRRPIWPLDEGVCESLC